ncbi:hypothetical protein ACIA5C_09250 [Actinoplanes sp. NPDC051343]|uniref:hypothetical protein n=1 Tax=Actinoplanes sp. NPDC051343 TaxID=3363906 RepID=UPI0037B4C528
MPSGTSAVTAVNTQAMSTVVTTWASSTSIRFGRARWSSAAVRCWKCRATVNTAMPKAPIPANSAQPYAFSTPNAAANAPNRTIVIQPDRIVIVR